MVGQPSVRFILFVLFAFPANFASALPVTVETSWSFYQFGQASLRDENDWYFYCNDTAGGSSGGTISYSARDIVAYNSAQFTVIESQPTSDIYSYTALYSAQASAFIPEYYSAYDTVAESGVGVWLFSGSFDVTEKVQLTFTSTLTGSPNQWFYSPEDNYLSPGRYVLEPGKYDFFYDNFFGFDTHIYVNNQTGFFTDCNSSFVNFTFTSVPIPEPSSTLLFGIGLAAFALIGRIKRR